MKNHAGCELVSYFFLSYVVWEDFWSLQYKVAWCWYCMVELIYWSPIFHFANFILKTGGITNYGSQPHSCICNYTVSLVCSMATLSHPEQPFTVTADSMLWTSGPVYWLSDLVQMCIWFIFNLSIISLKLSNFRSWNSFNPSYALNFHGTVQDFIYIVIFRITL